MRLFVALPLPRHALHTLAGAQAALARTRLPVRLTRLEGLHLTLAFLGETAPERVPIMRDLLDVTASQISPLTLEVSGLGAFPQPGRPRVLWAGVVGDLSRLAELHHRLSRHLAGAGFSVEERSFKPHVTLARVTGAVPPEALGSLQDWLALPLPELQMQPEPQVQTPRQLQSHPGAWTADTIHLMRSALRPDGARYTMLHASSLGASLQGGSDRFP